MPVPRSLQPNRHAGPAAQPGSRRAPVPARRRLLGSGRSRDPEAVARQAGRAPPRCAASRAAPSRTASRRLSDLSPAGRASVWAPPLPPPRGGARGGAGGAVGAVVGAAGSSGCSNGCSSGCRGAGQVGLDPVPRLRAETRVPRSHRVPALHSWFHS